MKDFTFAREYRIKMRNPTDPNKMLNSVNLFTDHILFVSLHVVDDRNFTARYRFYIDDPVDENETEARIIQRIEMKDDNIVEEFEALPINWEEEMQSRIENILKLKEDISRMNEELKLIKEKLSHDDSELFRSNDG